MDFNIAAHLLGRVSNLLEQAEKLTSHFAPFLGASVLRPQPWRSPGLRCLPAHRPLALPMRVPSPELALQHLDPLLRRL